MWVNLMQAVTTGHNQYQPHWHVSTCVPPEVVQVLQTIPVITALPPNQPPRPYHAHTTLPELTYNRKTLFRADTQGVCPSTLSTVLSVGARFSVLYVKTATCPPTLG